MFNRLGKTVFASLGIAFSLSACGENDNIGVSSLRVEQGWVSTTVTAAIVNGGNKATDVVVYLEKDNTYYCPKRTFIAAGQEKKISFRCDALSGNGRVYMHAKSYANTRAKMRDMARTIN